MGQGDLSKAAPVKQLEGRACETGRKEGAEANGSEEGVDLGRGGQESPVFPLLLFPGRAERLGHQGPQAPSPDGWPRCVLTADGGARGGTCGKRGGHSRVRRGWQGWGQEIRGARAPHMQGLGLILHCTLTRACEGRAALSPLSLGAVTYPISWELMLGASHAPFSSDFRLSGPPVQGKEVGGHSLGGNGVSENMRGPATGTDWFPGGSDGSCHRGKPPCLFPSGTRRDACGADGKVITAAVTC